MTDPASGRLLVEMKLPTFAFEILRAQSALQGQSLLIACSGGVDSVVLLEVFSKIAPRLGLELSVAHIHHGPGSAHRDQARAFVGELAASRGLKFFSRESATELKSEAALREFRLKSFKDILEESGAERVVLAHHADDLLETRLMRLIRGTGAYGLKSMRASTKTSLRPFLRNSRAELVRYANENQLTWIEDPSNRDEHFLRNWIRHSWIPLLEEKRPGAGASLARSLDLLSEAVPLEVPVSARFRRADFGRLSREAKREKLAALTRSKGSKNFGQSKIIEVLKRLDRLEVSGQRFAKFDVGGLSWCVTPHEIEAVFASPKTQA